MPQCQFPVFCCFCVSEKLHRKYSRNWTKQKLKSLITWHEDGVQRRAGDEPEARRTYCWRGTPLGRATRECDRLVHLLTLPLRLYKTSNAKTLEESVFFPDKVPQRCRRRRPISGDRSLCFGTLLGRGIALGGISIDSTAISIDVAVFYDEEGVVLPRGWGLYR
jgi:hypothetical protein